MGASGSATVGFEGFSQPGKVNWRVTGKQVDRTLVEVKFEYTNDIKSTNTALRRMVGAWTGQYRDGSTIAVSHAAQSRPAAASSASELVSGELKQVTTDLRPGAQLATASVQPPKAKAEADSSAANERPGGQLTAKAVGDVIGTLSMKDAYAKVTRMDVVVIASDAEKTVYSTGDVISGDGRVLPGRIGEDVFFANRLRGTWTIPLKAGTDGQAKIKVANVTYDGPGTVRWWAVPVAARIRCKF